MDKEALEILIEERKIYLNKPYQGTKSFLNEIIFPIFGEDKFEDKFKTEILKVRPEIQNLAKDTGINSIKFVGEIPVGLSDLQIFDITVADRISMERNRVGIQKVIRQLMDSYTCAFMIFHYSEDSRQDWRFSFCNKESSKSDFTDNKRYTYLLGPSQACRTAAERFVSLTDKKGNIEVEDLIAAFSVETLSNEFFAKYLGYYASFVKYLTGIPTSQENNIKEEKLKSVFKKVLTDMDDIKATLTPEDDKNLKTTRASFEEKYPNQEDRNKAIRDYVKKMLGRIVFLHFLQRKGWMYSDSVPDENFMKNLFLNASHEHKNDFLDTVLEPLFFAVLNTKPEDRINAVKEHNNKKYTDKNFKAEWDEELVKKWNKTPYLNGGLFEEEVTDMCRCIFPAKYFEQLLDFFSQYNFTINENDPSDALIGVDPEMLSRIFENLLEDNKEKGAYYTPKTIVRYMCQQSLIAYLQTNVTNNEKKQKIAQFVETYNVDLLGGEKTDFANEIDQKLRNVKICDPAIGSGAFPMGLLKELFFCRGAIENFDDATKIKKEIIQNNIYGVDIERGAVDIARLRFWLSLVVDEEQPQPLPNLDYKIMQGNSLLESFHGIDLSQITNTGEVIEGIQVRMVFDEESKQRELFHKALNDFFNCSSHDEKNQLREKINKHLQGLLDTQISNEKIKEEIKSLKPQNNQFFLWHTWFQDVFSNPDKQGFDIVIGNPPFVDSEAMTRVMPETREVYAKLYETAKGNWDMFVIFIELGINLCNVNGIYSFIIPNKIIAAKYTEELRN